MWGLYGGNGVVERRSYVNGRFYSSRGFISLPRMRPRNLYNIIKLKYPACAYISEVQKMAVKLVPKVHKCKRCNRALTNPESIDREYGPTCWTKLGNGLVTKKQTTQMVDKLSAAKLEDLEAKIYQAFDAIEELKMHGVTPLSGAPLNIPMPPNVNVSTEKVVPPDASGALHNDGGKLKLEGQIKSEIQTSSLYQKMKSNADIGRIVGDGIAKIVEPKPTFDDSIKKLVLLQEQIQGA